MMSDPSIEDDYHSLKLHGLVGALAVVGLLGGLGLWANATEIAGAVVAGGTIVVESYSKSVQHHEGGTVREILARNGDAVSAGDLLIRLDDTVAAANLAVIVSQVNDGLVQEARLAAEVEGLASFDPPIQLTIGDADVQVSLATQAKLLVAHIAARDGRVAQLDEQVVQFERQIEGLNIQERAIGTQIEIMRQEQVELAKLLADNLVESSRVNTMKRSLAQAEGERGRLIASVAEAGAAIAERKLQMTQIGDDFTSNALNELQKVRQALAELRQQRHAAEQRLFETQIRAPQAGFVHQSSVHTVGGVVAAGEVLMQIVPQDDALLVDIRVDPMDVDKLAPAQEVIVRLSSFDQRTTPEVHGAITDISPDFVQDRVTGHQFYTARVKLAASEVEALPAEATLRPGLPVQAFVTTSNRTVLSYLLHPLTEELNLALRED